MRHGALQRIVGSHLGQCRIPRHAGHVQGTRESRQATASDQIASLIVLLQDQRNMRLDGHKFTTATAGKALKEARITGGKVFRIITASVEY